jgi:hypothetical protein
MFYAFFQMQPADATNSKPKKQSKISPASLKKRFFYQTIVLKKLEKLKKRKRS